MLLMPNKKKIASIIVGGMGSDVSKAKPFAALEDKDEEDSEMGLVYAAEKIMSALSEGKVTSLVSALKEFMSMCGEYEEEEEEVGED